MSLIPGTRLIRSAIAVFAGALGLVMPAHAATVGNFSYGELQSSVVGRIGCGTNSAGEPAIHVSRANDVFLGSAPNASGNYNVYVASLNLGSVNVARSTDNGTTFSQSPVQVGLPVDDREWIAAFGANTSLLSYHDGATNNVDVLRSDNGGQIYAQISRVIPVTDYKATNNELGNLVIDHQNLPGTTGDFYAYQAFVAPSSPSGTSNNEAFLGVSADGGHTWSTIRSRAAWRPAAQPQVPRTAEPWRNRDRGGERSGPRASSSREGSAHAVPRAKAIPPAGADSHGCAPSAGR